MGRKTVRRMLRAGSLPEPASPRPRPSILDPHRPYLRDRWSAGYHNAHALWVELCARGFTGSPAIVRRLVRAWRPGPGRSGRPAQTISLAGRVSTPPRTPPTRALSPRQARGVPFGSLLRPPPDTEWEKHAYREQLLQSDPGIQQAYALTVEFEDVVRRASETSSLLGLTERGGVSSRSWSNLPEVWSGIGL